MSLITEPSICIPRTLNNVTWREVKDIFETILGRGTVDRVDIVHNRNDSTPFCRIFVHFRYWPVDKPELVAMRKRLIGGETVKVVYDNPWFWKCSASRIPKPVNTRAKVAPFVEFETAPVIGCQSTGKDNEKLEVTVDDKSDTNSIDDKSETNPIDDKSLDVVRDDFDAETNPYFHRS